MIHALNRLVKNVESWLRKIFLIRIPGYSETHRHLSFLRSANISYAFSLGFVLAERGFSCGQMSDAKPKLFHGPPTRSVRIYWLLKELEVPADIVPKDLFKAGDLTSPDLIAVNPLGTLPGFKDGDDIVNESGAALMYILGKYGNGKLELKPTDKGYGDYQQWFWFSEATMSQAVVRYLQHIVLLPEEKRVQWIADSTKEGVLKLLGLYEKQLEGKQWIAGDSFTAADIMQIHGLYLAAEFAKLLDKASFPNTYAYYEQLMARPFCKEAYGK
mmetsp:Transcript_32002/g.71110  ORF Transcript_32002/g.71110 Transcript_32002/m.71110 type:complete len:272 (-) Transcript_32002:609-1424(-)